MDNLRKNQPVSIKEIETNLKPFGDTYLKSPSFNFEHNIFEMLSTYPYTVLLHPKIEYNWSEISIAAII